MHFISKSHVEFVKCEHIVLPLKDIDIKNVDETSSLYIIEHTEQFDYYVVKCQFKLVFNDYECSPYKMSNLFDNRTMISWKAFWEKEIEDFEDKGYIPNHILALHIMTIVNKMDKTYHYYIKHKMHAVEFKLKKKWLTKTLTLSISLIEIGNTL